MKTSVVRVGDVSLGGGNPVAVQSMLNAPATDFDANAVQLSRLVDAGCEIVRMAVPTRESLHAFSRICALSPIPVVADIHFDADLACEAAYAGASALRINPGNIGGKAQAARVAHAAADCGIPIRIGVNAGSLDKDISSREDIGLVEKLALSASQYVSYFENELDFHALVVSAKAHDVMTTVETYRLLSRIIPHIPLHIGITEAGGLLQGSIKSAAGLGILLSEGIGDTLRISLTDDPVQEVACAWQLLSALDLRRRVPEIISCPTCGRTQVDMIPIASEIESRLQGMRLPLKVAVMGCVVNGPGEAADADVGVACGKGRAALFKHGKVVRSIPESEIVSSLMAEISQMAKEL